MKQISSLKWLVPLTGLLAFLAAAAGLFWPGTATTTSLTSVYGDTFPLFGQGLYRYDTLFTGSTLRGTDAVTLLVAIPLLVVGYLLYRRGSLRGGFLLTSAVAFLFYLAASLSFGAHYNELFILYIAYFVASLFTLITCLLAYQPQVIAGRISPRMPRRAIAWYLIAAGGILFLVWGSDLIGAVISGVPPKALETYTTIPTYVLDMGLITATLFVVGNMLLRRNPMGYPLAAMMLTVNAMVGLMVIGQTISEKMAGVVIAPAQVIIFVVSFLVMAAVASGFLVVLMRNVSDKG